MIPKLNTLSYTQQHWLEFLEDLKKLPFTGDISTDFATRIVSATDNSIYQILPQAVIYPADENDLIILCQLCDQKKYHDIVLSPRGGGTGTNGQSLTEGIAVDISKYMNEIIEINPEQGWVRVQAGVVKDQLNAALEPFGLFFAPELSTSNRATIGGMINTDASGQGSCLYGKTRDHVISIKTVLIDGSVIASCAIKDTELEAISEHQDKVGLIHRLINNIHREHKDLIAEIFPPLNRCLTGYDLAHIRDENQQFNLNNIICGSEGTLGFVSEAKLKVLPIPRYSALVIVKYANFDACLRDAKVLMKASPSSIETIDSSVLNLAMNDFSWHHVKEFFDEAGHANVKGINLVEFTAHGESELEIAIDKFVSYVNNKDSNDHNQARLGYSIARGEDSVKKIWAMRKRAVGLLGNIQGEARPIPFVEDTAVPPENLADFILEFRKILDSYELDYGMFGHVDAGVLHVRPALDMKKPESENIIWEISDRIAALTKQHHGLFWGEHGKGIRSQYSPQFFGKLYPQLQRIKSAFDPRNQMNPGKIATPEKSLSLLSIDGVPTRGQQDRNISTKLWEQFEDAVYCNGNGACFNWDPNDAMCPSWKASRERTQSPKGRASLIREWLRQLTENSSENTLIKSWGFWQDIRNIPEKIRSGREKSRGQYDFSHEVHASMTSCLACKSCAGQCPIQVNVPEFRSQFLELYHTRYFRPFKDHLVANLEKYLPLYAKAPRLYNFINNLKLTQIFLEKCVGFIDGPSLSLQNLRSLAVASHENLTKLSQDEKERTVIIVQDAFTSYFEANLVVDIFSFLKKLGFNPLLAPFMPNGKPLHVHGFLRKFTYTAQKNAQALNKLHQSGVPLVGIDPSMTLTYQSEYKKYVKNTEVPKVRLLQDWLASNVHKMEMSKKMVKAKHFRLMLHCTEKTNESTSGKLWQKVFSVFGHSVEIMEVGCCGMSGTFGHEVKNKPISTKLYQMSWQQPVEKYLSSESLMATGFSCRSQVKRETQRYIPHPIQMLYRAMD